MMRWLFLKSLGFVTGAASACSGESARNQRKMLKKNMYEQNEIQMKLQGQAKRKGEHIYSYKQRLCFLFDQSNSCQRETNDHLVSLQPICWANPTGGGTGQVHSSSLNEPVLLHRSSLFNFALG